MYDNESKFALKIGCMAGIIAVAIVPVYALISTLYDFISSIETDKLFNTKDGIFTVFFALYIAISLVFWFLILKKKLSIALSFISSFFFLIAEMLIIPKILTATKSLFVIAALMILAIFLKGYLIFNKKVNISSLGRLIGLLKKVDKTQLESFSFKTKRTTIKIDNPFAGIYVQGGAGSGKSLSLLKPMIKQGIEQDFAYIIYDFKGDLSLFEKEILEFNGLNESYTLNFKDPLVSHRFNPINPNYLNGSAAIFELAKTLFYNLSPGAIKQSNNYFLDEAINFFTSVVIFLKNKHKEYCTIPHIISAFSQVPIERMIPLISQDMEALPYIASLKNVLELGASKQLAGVTGTLQGNLAKFSSKELFWILSGSDFTPDINNPEDIKRLTIINDSVLPGFYGPLIAMIINVCLKNMNRPGMHKSAVYLDEAPTIYIPEFEQIPATARSNKIATIYACQDYMQIVDKYGREKAQTIISNLSSQFFGRTTNVESIKLISELFGKYDKRFQTISKGTSTEIFDIGDTKKSKNVGESIQERYNVTSNELTNLTPGDFYVITGSKKSKQSFKALPKIKKKQEIEPVSLRVMSYQTSNYDIESNYLNIHKSVERIFK